MNLIYFFGKYAFTKKVLPQVTFELYGHPLTRIPVNSTNKVILIFKAYRIKMKENNIFL